MNLIDAINETIDWLETAPQERTTFALARNQYYSPRSPNDPDATCWCALGRLAKYLDLDTSYISDVTAALINDHYLKPETVEDIYVNNDMGDVPKTIEALRKASTETIRHALVKTRDWLDTNPTNRIRYDLAVDDHDSIVQPNHPSATCWCVFGYFGKLLDCDNPDLSYLTRLAGKATNLEPDDARGITRDIWKSNDDNDLVAVKHGLNELIKAIPA